MNKNLEKGIAEYIKAEARDCEIIGAAVSDIIISEIKNKDINIEMWGNGVEITGGINSCIDINDNYNNPTILISDIVQGAINEDRIFVDEKTNVYNDIIKDLELSIELLKKAKYT